MLDDFGQKEFVEFTENLTKADQESKKALRDQYLEWSKHQDAVLLVETSLNSLKSSDYPDSWKICWLMILQQQVAYNSQLPQESVTKIAEFSLNLFINPPENPEVNKFNISLLKDLLVHEMNTLQANKTQKQTSTFLRDSLYFLISKSFTKLSFERKIQQLQVLDILISGGGTGDLLLNPAVIPCLNDLSQDEELSIQLSVSLLLFRIARYPKIQIASKSLEHSIKITLDYLLQEKDEQNIFESDQLFVYFSDWLKYNNFTFNLPISVVTSITSAILSEKSARMKSIEIIESFMLFVAEFLSHNQTYIKCQIEEMNNLVYNLLILGPRGLSHSQEEFDLDSYNKYPGEEEENVIIVCWDRIIQELWYRSAFKELLDTAKSKLKHYYTRQEQAWVHFGIISMTILSCYSKDPADLNQFIGVLLSFIQDAKDSKTLVLSLKACRRIVRMRLANITTSNLNNIITKSSELLQGKVLRLQFEGMLILVEIFRRDQSYVNIYKQPMQQTALRFALEAPEYLSQFSYDALIELSKSDNKFSIQEIEICTKLVSEINKEQSHRKRNQCLNAIQQIISSKARLRKTEEQEVKLGEYAIETILSYFKEEVIKKKEYRSFEYAIRAIVSLLRATEDPRIISPISLGVCEDLIKIMEELLNTKYIPGIYQRNKSPDEEQTSKELEIKSQVVDLEELHVSQYRKVDILAISAETIADILYLVGDLTTLKESSIFELIEREVKNSLAQALKNVWFCDRTVVNAFSSLLDAVFASHEWESSQKSGFYEGFLGLTNEIFNTKRYYNSFQSMLNEMRLGYKLNSLMYALDSTKALTAGQPLLSTLQQVINTYIKGRPQQTIFHLHGRNNYPPDIQFILGLLEGIQFLMEKSESFANDAVQELIKMTEQFHKLEKHRSFERCTILTVFKVTAKFTNLNDFPDHCAFVVQVCQDYILDYCCLVRKLAAECLTLFVNKGGKIIKLQALQYYNLGQEALNKRADNEYDLEFRAAKEAVLAMLGNVIKYFGAESGLSCINTWFDKLPIEIDAEKAEEQHRIFLNFIILDSDFLLNNKAITLNEIKYKVMQIDQYALIHNHTNLKNLIGQALRKLNSISTTNELS